jgi:hypothetical protein
MRFTHPEHPGRTVCLGYCLNVHPADDLHGVLQGLSEVAAPLARLLKAPGPFGVGLYLPEPAARELTRPAALTALLELLDVAGLEPFTYNAFPIERFHQPGLKAAVFAPNWADPRRREYTLLVARAALSIERRRRRAPTRSAAHMSISTHAGAHHSDTSSSAAALSQGLGQGLLELERLRQPGDPRLLLAVEPEPRSSANDSEQWQRLVPAWQTAAGCPSTNSSSQGALGLCLDACHAAVEFEDPQAAAGRARKAGRPLAKFQYTSALALPRPGEDAVGRERLLGLDEPVYLHQTSARLADGQRLGVGDLPELRAALSSDPRWLSAEEWRCHFHVPLGQAGPFGAAGGLGTTQAHADRLLGHLLADPGLWGLPELHVELETYTWGVLPSPPAGSGELVQRLAGEYAHALARLRAAGWSSV